MMPSVAEIVSPARAGLTPSVNIRASATNWDNLRDALLIILSGNLMLNLLINRDVLTAGASGVGTEYRSEGGLLAQQDNITWLF
jgi:hypothetical protein